MCDLFGEYWYVHEHPDDFRKQRRLSSMIFTDTSISNTMDLGNSQQSVWTGCNHNFHYDCLMKWMMASHDDCPTCRQELWKEDCYQQIALELGRLEAVRDTSSRSERAQAGNFRTWSSDAAARRRALEAEYNVACCCFRRLRWRRPGGWLCIFYAINMLLFLAGITYMVVSIAIRL